jgi:hypothetical protein
MNEPARLEAQPSTDCRAEPWLLVEQTDDEPSSA